MDPLPSQNMDDYSSSSTTITFDHPIPLLRVPVPVGPADDPSAGRYVLAFRDSHAWANAYKACESKIIEQCEAGTRIGCAISASNKCKPPWWRAVLGLGVLDLKDRERCEEQEMEYCLAAAKDKCVGFAKERCLKSFRDGRIAVRSRGLNLKLCEKSVCWATMVDGSMWVTLMGLDKLGPWSLVTTELGVTSCRATELLGSDPEVDSIMGETSGSGACKL